MQGNVSKKILYFLQLFAWIVIMKPNLTEPEIIALAFSVKNFWLAAGFCLIMPSEEPGSC